MLTSATSLDLNGVGQAASIVLGTGAAGSAKIGRIFGRVELRLLLEIRVDGVLILAQPSQVAIPVAVDWGGFLGASYACRSTVELE